MQLLLRVMGLNGPAVETLSITRGRRVYTEAFRMLGGRQPVGAVTDRTIDGPEGPVGLRFYTPRGLSGRSPALVYLHGGGWVQGNPEQSAWFASRVAARTGAVVLSFDYRLAPEDPFPAAVDDAWAALQWVVEHAEELDVDPDRVAVMGDSAGGGLAATTALLARDAGAPRLKAEVLIYPGVEMYDRWPSEDEFADAPVLSSANMRAFVRLYLRDQHGTLDWRASPIRAASHAGLPSTLVLVAGHDPLSDNGRRYAETLGEQGVHVVLQEFPDALHGFVSLPGVSPAATQAVDATARFLRDVL